MSSAVDANHIDWGKFKYMVFDVPKMLDSTYQQRYNLLGTSFLVPHFAHMLCLSGEIRGGSTQIHMGSREGGMYRDGTS